MFKFPRDLQNNWLIPSENHPFVFNYKLVLMVIM